ncbi:MAG: aminoacyl-tRNA hydrolase [Nitrospirota bacterium]
MWIVAGLGNPGRKYSRTRHNIGFMVVEEVAKQHKLSFKNMKGCRIGRGSVEGQDIILVEPLLYMNNSGAVIKEVMEKFDASPGNLIVIHDDLDMEIGKVRIRKRGSSGGHRGMESIIQSIGSTDFLRLKIGIGRGEGLSPEDYVLSKFKRSEMTIMKSSIKEAVEAIRTIILEGAEAAMNRFNR